MPRDTRSTGHKTFFHFLVAGLMHAEWAPKSKERHFLTDDGDDRGKRMRLQYHIRHLGALDIHMKRTSDRSAVWRASTCLQNKRKQLRLQVRSHRQPRAQSIIRITSPVQQRGSDMPRLLCEDYQQVTWSVIVLHNTADKRASNESSLYL